MQDQALEIAGELMQSGACLAAETAAPDVLLEPEVLQEVWCDVAGGEGSGL
jgi:hypothetical protein